jgi:hypothetical protein
MTIAALIIGIVALGLALYNFFDRYKVKIAVETERRIREEGKS